MTFKQKVVSEISGSCQRDECQNDTLCRTCKKRVDRILAAYKEAVEGMPRVEIKVEGKSGCKMDAVLFNSGADEQLEACKEHLQKEGK